MAYSKPVVLAQNSSSDVFAAAGKNKNCYERCSCPGGQQQVFAAGLSLTKERRCKQASLFLEVLKTEFVKVSVCTLIK